MNYMIYSLYTPKKSVSVNVLFHAGESTKEIALSIVRM